MEKYKALSSRSQFVVFASGILLVAAIWFLEMKTGHEISYAIFYLVPVAGVAWFTNRWYGITISAVCAVMWFGWELHMFPQNDLHLIVWNAAMRFGFFVIVSLLLSALNNAYRREASLARTDRIAKTANNRFFHEVTTAEVSRSKRYGHPISAVYLDLDNFKSVNDRFGHRTGDELLRRVAETIDENIRDSDVVARIGGDEFAILLPETGKDAADAVITKVHQSLLATMKQKNWPVTFSVGAVTFLHAPDSANEILEKADDLMYSVKRSGKNGVRHITLDRPVFSKDDRSRLEESQRING